MVGTQQLVGHPAAEQREREREQGDGDGRGLPRPVALDAGDGEQPEHRHATRAQRVQRPVGLRGVEQDHPVQRAEAGEADEGEPARGRHRQRRVALERAGQTGGGGRGAADRVT